MLPENGTIPKHVVTIQSFTLYYRRCKHHLHINK